MKEINKTFRSATKYNHNQHIKKTLNNTSNLTKHCVQKGQHENHVFIKNFKNSPIIPQIHPLDSSAVKKDWERMNNPQKFLTLLQAMAIVGPNITFFAHKQIDKQQHKTDQPFTTNETGSEALFVPENSTSNNNAIAKNQTSLGAQFDSFLTHVINQVSPWNMAVAAPIRNPLYRPSCAGRLAGYNGKFSQEIETFLRGEIPAHQVIYKGKNIEGLIWIPAGKNTTPPNGVFFDAITEQWFDVQTPPFESQQAPEIRTELVPDKRKNVEDFLNYKNLMAIILERLPATVAGRLKDNQDLSRIAISAQIIADMDFLLSNQIEDLQQWESFLWENTATIGPTTKKNIPPEEANEKKLFSEVNKASQALIQEQENETEEITEKANYLFEWNKNSSVFFNSADLLDKLIKTNIQLYSKNKDLTPDSLVNVTSVYHNGHAAEEVTFQFSVREIASGNYHYKMNEDCPFLVTCKVMRIDEPELFKMMENSDLQKTLTGDLQNFTNDPINRENFKTISISILKELVINYIQNKENLPLSHLQAFEDVLKKPNLITLLELEKQMVSGKIMIPVMGKNNTLEGGYIFGLNDGLCVYVKRRVITDDFTTNHAVFDWPESENFVQWILRDTPIKFAAKFGGNFTPIISFSEPSGVQSFGKRTIPRLAYKKVKNPFEQLFNGTMKIMEDNVDAMIYTHGEQRWDQYLVVGKHLLTAAALVSMAASFGSTGYLLIALRVGAFAFEIGNNAIKLVQASRAHTLEEQDFLQKDAIISFTISVGLPGFPLSKMMYKGGNKALKESLNLLRAIKKVRYGKSVCWDYAIDLARESRFILRYTDVLKLKKLFKTAGQGNTQSVATLVSKSTKITSRDALERIKPGELIFLTVEKTNSKQIVHTFISKGAGTFVGIKNDFLNPAFGPGIKTFSAQQLGNFKYGFLGPASGKNIDILSNTNPQVFQVYSMNTMNLRLDGMV